MEYQVDLDVFRGPLDLLLYLVKRDEVDIHDIPMARITEQYIEYLQLLEMIDVEHAGEFLVMAATLMEIKSRMLLPRAESLGSEEEDPRSELVRQLLEYKKYKDAANLLELQAERQLSRMPRLSLEVPGSADPSQQPLRQVELWDLVSAFGRLMRETLALQPQHIIADQTPVQVYMEQIVERLRAEGSVSFSALFVPPQSRGRLVGLFLAILELVKAGHLLAEQGIDFGDISLRLTPADGDKAASN